MGFFSFIHELMWKDLAENGMPDLRLGTTVMKTTFTQIYDKTLQKANEVIEKNEENITTSLMPEIFSANDTLKDIFSGRAETEVIKWIRKNAE